MFLRTTSRAKIELIEIKSELKADLGRLVLRAANVEDPAGRLTRAANAFFGLQRREREVTPKLVAEEPPLAVFREKDSGLIRIVHKEIVCRLKKSISAKVRDQIFDKLRLELRSRNPFVAHQYVLKCRAERRTGVELVGVANELLELDEVEFATPNFVSEFQRNALPTIPNAQWHLKNLAAVSGQKLGEDVKAEGAWALTQGKPSIVVAVLDDGVDVDHPNLKPRIKRNPDPNEPRDKVGRDFFVPDDNSPEHFDPRPKLFQFPFDAMAGNDIHGTPCAGVIVASGKGADEEAAWGIAPKCRLLAVKIFHADNLASDARVADAIRYASRFADVLSCSWSSGYSDDVNFAISDDAAQGRDGRGSAVFCAAGNDFGRAVSYPARLPAAIAVSASTDQAKHAAYSNVGPEVWICAPSSGGKRGIFTTDVSTANRGFNLGSADAGGADGLHTNDFGGTSSATPLAAGIAALMLSVKPSLSRDDVKQILANSADKIGSAAGYDGRGHSVEFGFGRVNTESAVAAAKRAD